MIPRIGTVIGVYFAKLHPKDIVYAGENDSEKPRVGWQAELHATAGNFGKLRALMNKFPWQGIQTSHTARSCHSTGNPATPSLTTCLHGLRVVRAGLYCSRSHASKVHCTMTCPWAFYFTDFSRGGESIRGLEGRKLMSTSTSTRRSQGATCDRATETARMYPCPVGSWPTYI